MVATDDNIEVVISGIGGYFPKCRNFDEFQEKLYNQEELFDVARWESDSTKRETCDTTGNVDAVNLFDASYFGIHRQQTVFMDPMSRMTLQNTFEALIDAGVNPMEVRGKRVGVFIASTLSENDSLMFESVENGFGVTGQARTMLANRISYWMNANGPSYSCDHSWLGGLQVLQNGVNAVKSGQCESAIVGAVNMAMNIFPHYLYKSLKLISSDGCTRSFDENANGYVRSDGLVILYLQRADVARRSYCTVMDVQVEFNGIRSGQLSHINIDCARRFLKNFYQRINVDPSTVQFVEAYGSALKNLDELELNVIDDVFNCKQRDQPLLVGSVKSNAGHSEATSSLFSVVKTIIAMKNNKIPANKSYNNGNENVPALHNGKIKIVTEVTPWDGKLAAVNGYGLISSFGHCLLKGPTDKPKAEQKDDNNLPHLYILSTRTEDGMKEIIEKIKSQPTLNTEYRNLINNTFKMHIPAHLYRCYVIRSSLEKSVDEISHFSGINRPIWFVYSGMGSQWLTMGRSLLQLPIFARAIEKCHKALLPHGIDIYHILTTEEDTTIFNNILHSFVGIAAIQIGLTDILFALGVKPNFIIGHSVGELGCAYADGCLTAEQMILSSYYRGRASTEVKLEPGLMAAIGIGAQKMQSQLPPGIDIACRNGPDSCTISGPASMMTDLVKKIQEQGVFARSVDVAGIAYHSRYIRPAAPRLLNYLKNLIPNPKARSSKWLSTSIPEANGGWNSETAKHASAEYLTNNLLSCVYFEEALQHVPKEAILIEVAPHGLLQAILKRSLHESCDNISLTKRGEKNGIEFLLSAVGKMYLTGLSLNICQLYKSIEDIENNAPDLIIPCSKDTPTLSSLVCWSHSEVWRTGLDEFKVNSNSEQSFMLDINAEMFHYLHGHRVYTTSSINNKEGFIIVPFTAYLPLVCSVLSNNHRISNITFEDLHLQRHNILMDAVSVIVPKIRVTAQPGSRLFEVCDRNGLILQGRYDLSQNYEKNILIKEKCEDNLGKKLDELKSDEIYREFASRGHNFQDSFRSISQIELYEKGLKAFIEWKTGWQTFVSGMLQLSIFREGDATKKVVDTMFLRSLYISFSEDLTPTEGSLIEVTYNYISKTITSPIVTLQDPQCEPYENKNSFITEKINENETENIVNDEYPILTDNHIKNHISNVDVHYLGINSAHVIPEISHFQEIDKTEGILNVLSDEVVLIKRHYQRNQIGLIDYGGIEKNTNHRIMGVAHTNFEQNLTADPVLKWTIPNDWSLLEGTTVPFVYTIAYYALLEQAGLEPGESILIHNGCSPIGQAMIRVAYARGSVIYTTVASPKQRSILLDHFKMLRNESIFDYTDESFEQKIMIATQGAGVKVLINCLSGNSLRASLRCISTTGRGILLQEDTLTKDYYTGTVGLSLFFKCTALFGLHISKIHELPDDVKYRIHKHISDGIKRKHIVPIRRHIFRDRGRNQIDHIIRYLLGSKVEGSVIIPVAEGKEKQQKPTIKQINKDDSTYIVYGHGNIDHLITQIFWLTHSYRAKRIIAFTSFTNNGLDTNFVNRSLNVLRLNYPRVNVDLIEVSPKKPLTGVQEIIRRKIPNISAAIILLNKNSNDNEFIEHLQKKINTDKIILVSSVANQIELSKTISKHNIKYLCWSDECKFIDIVNYVKETLEESTNIYVRSDNKDKTMIKKYNFSYQDFFYYLSLSLPCITKCSVPESNISIKIATTTCPSFTNESPPVFLVPGLTGERCTYLKSTLRRIMSPAYILDSKYELPLNTLAKKFAKEIKILYPTGPYNIIGISSGGPLAIEIVKSLEIDLGETTQLYLIDGTSDVIQNILLDASSVPELKIERNYEILLLIHLLNITDSQTISELYNAPVDWKKRLNIALRDCKLNVKRLTTILTVVKTKLEVVLNYTPNDNRIITGITRFLKPQESSQESINMNSFCKHVKIEVVKGNHFSMLHEDNNLVTYINENIIVSPIYV